MKRAFATIAHTRQRRTRSSSASLTEWYSGRSLCPATASCVPGNHDHEYIERPYEQVKICKQWVGRRSERLEWSEWQRTREFLHVDAEVWDASRTV